MISCQNGVLLEHKPQMSTVKWLKSIFGRSAYCTVLSRAVTLKLPSKKSVSNSPFIKLSLNWSAVFRETLMDGGGHVLYCSVIKHT